MQSITKNLAFVPSGGEVVFVVTGEDDTPGDDNLRIFVDGTSTLTFDSCYVDVPADVCLAAGLVNAGNDPIDIGDSNSDS